PTHLGPYTSSPFACWPCAAPPRVCEASLERGKRLRGLQLDPGRQPRLRLATSMSLAIRLIPPCRVWLDGVDPVSRTPDGASRLRESGIWQSSERSTPRSSSE